MGVGKPHPACFLQILILFDGLEPFLTSIVSIWGRKGQKHTIARFREHEFGQNSPAESRFGSVTPNPKEETGSSPGIVRSAGYRGRRATPSPALAVELGGVLPTVLVRRDPGRVRGPRPHRPTDRWRVSRVAELLEIAAGLQPMHWSQHPVCTGLTGWHFHLLSAGMKVAYTLADQDLELEADRVFTRNPFRAG